jgi:hypothetical protein
VEQPSTGIVARHSHEVAAQIPPLGAIDRGESPSVVRDPFEAPTVLIRSLGALVLVAAWLVLGL